MNHDNRILLKKFKKLSYNNKKKVKDILHIIYNINK